MFTGDSRSSRRKKHIIDSSLYDDRNGKFNFFVIPAENVGVE